jgi:hypothetical protein
MRVHVAALAALTACLVAAAPALAKHETATAGQVSATFTYFGDYPDGFTGLQLTIARAGTTVYDRPVAARDCDEPWCAPGGGRGRSLHARDLDGDGEPEVLLDLYTGGAHCCVVGQIFTFDAPGYRKAAERNWADAGYRLADIDGNGTLELKSADARFAYAFAAFAFSAFPVQVFHWRAGRLVDVTERFRRAMRKDARRWMHVYRHADYEPQGALAAWAADQYQLGHRAYARRVVRRAVQTGRLRDMPGASRFPRKLDRRLRRWGY